MKKHETFGGCLQRVLAEAGMSASEAARLVCFRSRNSIFRILSDDTSCEIDGRFLSALKEAVGDAWPAERWKTLDEALAVKRVGPEQHLSNSAFFRVLHSPELETEYLVHSHNTMEDIRPLQQLLTELTADSRLEMIITGSCAAELSRLLTRCCTAAGDEGRLTIRQYIDIDEAVAVQSILGILPLISKPWYNARMVDDNICPEETKALLRVSAIYILQEKRSGQDVMHQLIRYDGQHYLHKTWEGRYHHILPMIDRWRYQLELLKPMPELGGSAEDFAAYTARYQQLEHDCTILSIKPDIHFNCIRREQLENAIMEGFAQAGIAAEPELVSLMDQLIAIHEARYQNMAAKHRPTHLVYSLEAMERFMRTGVQSDHFFLQRAYTVEERRAIIGDLRQTMLENPYFNVHFLKKDMPELYYEMTCYEGKGVLLLDAFTGYALHDDHSEALITLPAFMQRFRSFFHDELLQKHVMSRTETLAVLEQLMCV